MSRSRKDGKRGGGHRNTQGREYWSARPGYPMAEPGRDAKTRTHRAERRVSRAEVRAAAERVMQVNDACLRRLAGQPTPTTHTGDTRHD